MIVELGIASVETKDAVVSGQSDGIQPHFE